MRPLILIITLLLISFISFSQQPFEAGGEYMRSIGQGFQDNIAGLRTEAFSKKNGFSLGLVYQFSSNSSYSSGKGFGFFGGYRYSFGKNVNGNNPFLGVKLMFNLLSWEGKSSLFSPMITPVAEAGYHLTFAKHIFATPAIGYGYTLRIMPDNNSLDEDAGKRIIPSLSAGYRFIKAN